MGKLPENLQRKVNIFWFRRRVPDALRPVIGKREIRVSLKTADLGTAKQRLNIERLKAQAMFDGAQRKIAASAKGSPQDTELTDAEALVLASQWLIQEEKKHAETLPSTDTEDILERLAIATDTEDYSWVGREARKLLAAHNLDIPGGSPSYERLMLVMQEALIEREKRLLARFSARSVTLNSRFANPTGSTQLIASTAMTLEELLKQFRRESQPGKSPKTALRRDAQDRLFMEVLGAKTPVNAIDRSKAKQLKEVLERLPPNWSNKFPGTSAAKVLEMNHSHFGMPMSSTTANSYLAAFSSAMEYAVNEHLIDRNPAKDLRVTGEAVKAKEKRLSFSLDDLIQIFSAPLYRGCRDDEKNWSKLGNARPRRARFWIPLISLFSGMRLNEICQLCEDDIAIRDGVEVMLVRGGNDGTKRVKTTAGERCVPIHPELKKIGFIEHVTEIRERHPAQSRLFPEVKQASTGYFSDNFTGWFAKFLDSLSIDDRRKAFHSFRHTFIDAVKEANVPTERIRALAGWSGSGMEAVYGSGLKPRTLAAEIAKVYYPGLDLAHLRK